MQVQVTLINNFELVDLSVKLGVRFFLFSLPLRGADHAEKAVEVVTCKRGHCRSGHFCPKVYKCCYGEVEGGQGQPEATDRSILRGKTEDQRRVTVTTRKRIKGRG